MSISLVLVRKVHWNGHKLETYKTPYGLLGTDKNCFLLSESTLAFYYITTLYVGRGGVNQSFVFKVYQKRWLIAPMRSFVCHTDKVLPKYFSSKIYVSCKKFKDMHIFDTNITVLWPSEKYRRVFNCVWTKTGTQNTHLVYETNIFFQTSEKREYHFITNTICVHFFV